MNMRSFALQVGYTWMALPRAKQLTPERHFRHDGVVGDSNSNDLSSAARRRHLFVKSHEVPTYRSRQLVRSQCHGHWLSIMRYCHRHSERPLGDDLAANVAHGQHKIQTHEPLFSNSKHSSFFLLTAFSVTCATFP